MALLDDIKQTYRQHANEENSEYMLEYMRFQFEYFGIKSPVRRAISKPFLKTVKTLPKEEAMTLIKDLWFSPQRELQHLAIDIAVPYFKKNPGENDLRFFLILVHEKPWWDTIDFIASKLMGNHFLLFPEQRHKYINQWIESGNIWLIRCAILFQLKYKAQTDLELLYDIILRTCHTQEFFINKAIGWVLRENSKRIPDEIMAFVKTNQNKLSTLSKKEAIRIMIPPPA